MSDRLGIMKSRKRDLQRAALGFITAVSITSLTINVVLYDSLQRTRAELENKIRNGPTMPYATPINPGIRRVVCTLDYDAQIMSAMAEHVPQRSALEREILILSYDKQILNALAAQGRINPDFVQQLYGDFERSAELVREIGSFGINYRAAELVNARFREAKVTYDNCVSLGRRIS